jgi:hypothetical protein
MLKHAEVVPRSDRQNGAALHGGGSKLKCGEGLSSWPSIFKALGRLWQCVRLDPIEKPEQGEQTKAEINYRS